MADRVIAGRILCDAGDNCRLGYRQLAGGFAEIALRCRLDTECILTEVDGIHVLEKDLILVVIFGDLQRKVLLLKLTLDLFNRIFSLGGPVCEDRIFQQLLGDGTCTLCLRSAGFQELPAGTQHTLEVNAVVQIETLVLDGNEGFAEVVRQLVHGLHAETVGVGADILVDLIALAVVDNRCLTGCNDSVQPDGRRGGKDAPERTDPRGNAADADTDNGNQHQLHKAEQDFLFYFYCFGIQCLLLRTNSLLSIIHEIRLSG